MEGQHHEEPRFPNSTDNSKLSENTQRLLGLDHLYHHVVMEDKFVPKGDIIVIRVAKLNPFTERTNSKNGKIEKVAKTPQELEIEGRTFSKFMEVVSKGERLPDDAVKIGQFVRVSDLSLLEGVKSKVDGTMIGYTRMHNVLGVCEALDLSPIKKVTEEVVAE